MSQKLNRLKQESSRSFFMSIPCSFLIENKPLKTSFETAVTEAIDDIFSTFGESNKQAIYSHLENSYGIKKEKIPLRIEEFTKAIEQTFGEVAKVLEIKIIERLHVKYSDFFYVSKKSELHFDEFVANLKCYLETQA